MLPKVNIPVAMLTINHVFATVKKMRAGRSPEIPHNRTCSTLSLRSYRAGMMRGRWSPAFSQFAQCRLKPVLQHGSGSAAWRQPAQGRGELRERDFGLCETGMPRLLPFQAEPPLIATA